MMNSQNSKLSLTSIVENYKYLVMFVVGFMVSIAHAKPPSYGTWAYQEAYSDEFTGPTVNLEKWDNFTPYWTGQAPDVYTRKNVEVKNGLLFLHTTNRQEDVGRLINTAFFKNKQPIKYGYFEIRAKAMHSKAISAFWLYRYTPTATYEIDIVEIAGIDSNKSHIHHSNTHVYYGDPELESEHNRISSPKKYQHNQKLSQDFNLYALEWDELEIRWYFNDKLIRREANRHWNTPMFIQLSTEVVPQWFGIPEKSSLPKQFEVDYVRVWKRTDIELPK
jgi:hypothetical protein